MAVGACSEQSSTQEKALLVSMGSDLLFRAQLLSLQEVCSQLI